ncbi:MAG: hypothetical protein ACOVKL_00755 [Polynucleobacter sp.]|jgi:hypothetical protein
MNADYIITQVAQQAATIYENQDPRDRLAFQVGMLQAKIRSLCYLINVTSDQLKQIQLELTKEQA